MEIPTRAQVLVIGGGIVGASAAYHLARLGIRDVVLIEQNRIGGGTTWHAAGDGHTPALDCGHGRDPRP